MSEHAPWSTLDLVVVDIEGNGQRPPELVELAAVPVVGGVVGEPVSWLVRPPSPITWPARKVHGISDAAVAELPTFNEVADEVRRTLGNTVPVGHNVKIDLDVMTRSLPQWSPIEAFDTLRMARATWSLPSHKLAALVNHCGLAAGLPDGMQPHRATYDALVTARLLVELAQRSRPEPYSVAELRRVGGLAFAHDEPQPGLFG